MSRNLIAVLLTCLLSAFAQTQNVTSKVDDISGPWILTEVFPDETHTHRMSLQVADNKITGQSGTSKIEGGIADLGITLKWLNTDGSVQATYTGTAQSGALQSSASLLSTTLRISSARRSALWPRSRKPHWPS